MLAFSDARPIGPLTAYTDRTITNVDELEAELQRIARRGWADAYEEREQSLNAIAAPVWSNGGELAGIVALQGPIPRFGRAAARAALPALLARTSAISAELGSQST
jgi:DNA-binding IclR family transcriptional regulator